MKRRDFIIGTAAVATVASMPRPVFAELTVGQHVTEVLRYVASGGSMATARYSGIPDNCYYVLESRGWNIVMSRCSYPWETAAFVEQCTDPSGEPFDQKHWGIKLTDDPMAFLTTDEQAAFDRLVVEDMRERCKR